MKTRSYSKAPSNGRFNKTLANCGWKTPDAASQKRASFPTNWKNHGEKQFQVHLLSFLYLPFAEKSDYLKEGKKKKKEKKRKRKR